MKKFLKILKYIWIPLLLLAFAGYLAIGDYVVPADVMVDEMIEAADAGTITDNYYTNTKLGIQFYTPPVEDGAWRPMTYTEQFTKRPHYVYDAAKAEFAVFEPFDKPYPDFIFRARFEDMKMSNFKNETTKQFAQRLRNKYVREIISGNKNAEGFFDHSYEYTEIVPVIINEKTYYKYGSYDKDNDLYYLSYVIREGGFGFRFMFYGQGEVIDATFVKSIMDSVVYFEQDFTVAYKRKSIIKK
jgi:hypothetical protein